MIYVQTYLTCQQIKAGQQRPGGELQLIQIPECKWDDISIDFIMGLPQKINGYDTILVIMDRFSKSAHFLQIKITYTMDHLAELYIRKVVRLHGVPRSIISERIVDSLCTFGSAYRRR